jgi:hypothetical protein
VSEPDVVARHISARAKFHVAPLSVVRKIPLPPVPAYIVVPLAARTFGVASGMVVRIPELDAVQLTPASVERQKTFP